MVYVVLRISRLVVVLRSDTAIAALWVDLRNSVHGITLWTFVYVGPVSIND